MIVVKLEFGLGNQLFQYAKGRAESIKRKQRLVLDTSYFAGRQRTYSGPQQEQFWLKYLPIHYDGLIERTDYFANHESFKDLIPFYDETWPSNKAPGESETHCYIRGFWQNESHFIGIRNLLLQEISTEDSRTVSGVSISVRRGDFLQRTDRPVMSLDYYKKAIAVIRDRVQNPQFFVFSDDDNWVEENMRSIVGDYTYVPRTVCYKDMLLLSKCQHHIIPNSTFSWWGAWLSNNLGKIVITPSSWNNNGLDIAPADWIRITSPA